MLFSKLVNFLGLAAVSSTILISSPSAQAASCGEASFYGTSEDGYSWKRTASGAIMNPNAHTTAHRYLPFGTRLRVTNQDNGRSVKVTVLDRGPYVSGRSLDLSFAAFRQIASSSQGVARVCYSII
jgi:rare lipoprotein A